MTILSDVKNEKTYRVEGLSCTNCAAKFEKNVKGIPGVTNAKVNFGAGKIDVEGTATIKEIEWAGAFEKLVIQDEKEASPQKITKESFLKRNWTLVIAAILIGTAFYAQFTLGEDNLVTKGLYVFAIMIGGFQLFKEGLSDLFKLDFSMEVLMTIAIIGASIIG